MKCNYEKIMVLSNTPPGWKGGGGVLIESLIEGYGRERFCFFCTRKIYADENYETPESLRKMPTRFAPLRIFKRKRYRIIPFLEETIYIFLLIEKRREIISFAKENNVGLVWATLRGDSLPLTNYVVNKLKLNLIVSIQDPVESEWRDKKLIYWMKKRNYYKAIKAAKYLAAAGESMVQYLKKEFNKESIIQRKGVDIVKGNDKREPFDSNTIKIGFAGSLYAVDEWKHFLSALSEFAKKHSNYKIKILYVGKTKPCYQIKKVDIEYFGWSSQDRVIEMMSEVDVGYLPYKFARKDRIQMQLSFPNKIVVYLASGTPVFFHGPSYSSVNYFLNIYPCGVSCDSNSQELIISKLENLIFDRKYYGRCKKACRETLEKEFTRKKMLDNFKYFISRGFESN